MPARCPARPTEPAPRVPALGSVSLPQQQEEAALSTAQNMTENQRGRREGGREDGGVLP